MWFNDPQHSWQLGLLAAGTLLLLLRMVVPFLRSGKPERALLVVMLFVGLGSSLAYTRFLDFHGPRRGMLHIYHDHDIYHYAIGAKYYPEVGHERLYECTWLAFEEMAGPNKKAPQVRGQIRSLRNPDVFFKPQDRRDKFAERCPQHFSPERWNDLKRDLQAWLADGTWNTRMWMIAFQDLGYNPPPTYNLIAHNLIADRPLDNATLQLLPFVDMTLVFAVGGVFVWWAFGPWAFAAYLVIFGTNWVANYRWTGGSYCRQLWFAWLVVGVSLLKKEHFAWAGAAVAMCVLMRFFPAVFAVGALAAVAGAAWRDTERRQDLARFVGGGLAATVAAVGASLIQFGPGLWTEFFDKMSHHGVSWFMWHIGFKKFVAYDAIEAETGGWTARGDWWIKPADQEATFQAARWWAEPLRIGLSLAALGLATLRKPTEAALFVGGCLLFLWAMPANYYYVYMALLPVVFYDPDGDRFALFRITATFAAMASLSCSAFVHAQPYIQNGWMNKTVFWFWVVILASYAVQEGLPWWRARQSSSPASARA